MMEATKSQAPAANSRKDFRLALTEGLLDASRSFKAGNRDFVRYEFNLHARTRWHLHNLFHGTLARFGFVFPHYTLPSEWLEFITTHVDEFEAFHRRLTDEESARLFIELLKYYVLGEFHVRLPSNGAHFAKAQNSIPNYFVRQTGRRVGQYTSELGEYRYPAAGGEIRMLLHPIYLRNTFLLEQYAYRNGSNVVVAEPGDVVIDGGGCWGDTALYFADKVGKSGRVFAFEFDETNREVFANNLKLNPGLAPQITLMPRPMWSVTGEKLRYTPHRGAQTSLDGNGGGTSEVETLTIDDCVREHNTRVDLIKMDIEGAELEALRGARETIKRFRPKLAISAYHKKSDLIEIPKFIDTLGVDYEFFLGHVTINQEETVLFGRPSSCSQRPDEKRHS